MASLASNILSCKSVAIHLLSHLVGSRSYIGTNQDDERIEHERPQAIPGLSEAAAMGYVLQMTCQCLHSLVQDAGFWNELRLHNVDPVDSLRRNLSKHLQQHGVTTLTIVPWAFDTFDTFDIDPSILNTIADSGVLLRELHLHNSTGIEFEYPDTLGPLYEANLSCVALNRRLVSLTACGLDGSDLFVALSTCPLQYLCLTYLAGTLEVGMAVFTGAQSRARASLRTLELGNCHRLGEGPLASLGTLPRLRELGLSDCRITPSGMRGLRNAELTHFDIGAYHSPPPTDASVLSAAVREFHGASLRVFTAMQNEWFTDPELCSIARGCPSLCVADVSLTRITTVGCSFLLKTCSKLTHLNLSLCEGVLGTIEQSVTIGTALKQLNIKHCSNIPERTAVNLRSKVPGLIVQHCCNAGLCNYHTARVRIAIDIN